MALCCNARLDPCPKCKNDTWVHVERERASDVGFGCVDCGEVKEVLVPCSQPGCDEEMKVYTLTGYVYPEHYCLKHD